MNMAGLQNNRALLLGGYCEVQGNIIIEILWRNQGVVLGGEVAQKGENFGNSTTIFMRGGKYRH